MRSAGRDVSGSSEAMSPQWGRRECNGHLLHALKQRELCAAEHLRASRGSSRLWPARRWRSQPAHTACLPARWNALGSRRACKRRHWADLTTQRGTASTQRFADLVQVRRCRISAEVDSRVSMRVDSERLRGYQTTRRGIGGKGGGTFAVGCLIQGSRWEVCCPSLIMIGARSSGDP